MKKILLTLICGFGLTAAFAQEPAKVAKKKKLITATTPTEAALKTRTQAKEAKVRELEAQSTKATPVTPASKAQGSKAAETLN